MRVCLAHTQTCLWLHFPLEAVPVRSSICCSHNPRSAPTQDGRRLIQSNPHACCEKLIVFQHCVSCRLTLPSFLEAVICITVPGAAWNISSSFGSSTLGLAISTIRPKGLWHAVAQGWRVGHIGKQFVNVCVGWRTCARILLPLPVPKPCYKQ